MSSSSIVDNVFKEFLEKKVESQTKASRESTPERKKRKKDHKSHHHKKHKKHKSKEKEKGKEGVTDSKEREGGETSDKKSVKEGGSQQAQSQDNIPETNTDVLAKQEKCDTEKEKKKDKKHKKHKHKEKEKDKNCDRSRKSSKEEETVDISDNSSTVSKIDSAKKSSPDMKSAAVSVDSSDKKTATDGECVIVKGNSTVNNDSNGKTAEEPIELDGNVIESKTDQRRHRHRDGDRDKEDRRRDHKRHKHKKHKSREKDLGESGRPRSDVAHPGVSPVVQPEVSQPECSQAPQQGSSQILQHLWAEDSPGDSPADDIFMYDPPPAVGGSAWMTLPKELEKNPDVNASAWMRLPKDLENEELHFDSGDADLTDFSKQVDKKKKKDPPQMVPPPPQMVPPPTMLPKLDIESDMTKLLVAKTSASSKTADLISRIKDSVIGDLKKEDSVEQSSLLTGVSTPDVAGVKLEPLQIAINNDKTNFGDGQAAAVPKKAGFGSLKLGIKISETSAALIASGEKVENDPVRKNMEEGEVTDSSARSSSDTEDSDPAGDKNKAETDSDVHISDLSSSGCVTDSEPENTDDKKKKKEKKKKKKQKDNKKRKHSKSRSRSPKKHKRSRSSSRTRAKSFDENKGVWRSKSRSRSRSRGRRRSKSRERHKRRSREKDYRRRSRDRHYDSRDRHSRGRHSRRSRSRSRSPIRGRITKDLRVKIDKAKLRQIAFQNAFAMQQSGIKLAPDQVAALKAGGKSVEELTDFCKKISEKDTQRRSFVRSSDESDSEKEAVGSDEEPVFIHHPFNVKEAAIVMNIRNSRPIPILTKDDKQAQCSVLRLQFPVSSGSHHRDKEKEWVPVEKTQPQKTTAAPSAANAVALIGAQTPAPPPPPAQPLAIMPKTTSGPEAALDLANQVIAEAKAGAQLAIMAPPVVNPKDKVFPDPPSEPINIGDVVSQRLSAMRKLQDNPHDVEAMGKMYKINERMSQWAHSKNLPGMFTGTTGAQILSQSQLAGIHQVWSKKDQLKTAAPVSGGIGRLLLQRMGWKEGEGLGKEGAGSTLPLMLDVKVDRKGLTSQEETSKKVPRTPAVSNKDLSGKHPVSALVELCNRRKWGAPNFILVTEAGPDHKKNFLFKVIVNHVEYRQASGSSNKKQAKAAAATVCLQELGLIPR